MSGIAGGGGARPGTPLRRSSEGVLRDPEDPAAGRPEADDAALVRAVLRSGRRFRVIDEETGEDCTVEVLAEFLVGTCVRPAGLLLGPAARGLLGFAPGAAR